MLSQPGLNNRVFFLGKITCFLISFKTIGLCFCSTRQLEKTPIFDLYINRVILTQSHTPSNARICTRVIDVIDQATVYTQYIHFRLKTNLLKKTVFFPSSRDERFRIVFACQLWQAFSTENSIIYVLTEGQKRGKISFSK